MRKHRIPAILSLVIWGVMWELVGRFGGISLIPPVTAIFAAAVEIAQFGSFYDAIIITGRSFFLGMGLAIAVGIPLGVLMGTVRPAAKILNIWVNILISTPLTAVVPALMPILGIGQTTVTATVFLFAAWVLVIDTQAGIVNVNRSLIEMGKVYGASRTQLFFKVLLPAAMPEILAGLRLSVMRGVKGVIIGQIIIALIGFGALFETYLQRFLMEHFWALVFIIFALAFLLVEGIAFLERRVHFYASSR